MRRSGILSLLAAATALMMALSGCGGGEPSSQESQASSQSQSASESSIPESSSPASAPESGAASESSAPESTGSQSGASTPSSQSAPSQSSAPASSSQAAPAEPILYQDEEVLEVWALDGDTHTTVPYVPGGENQPDGERLEAALNDAPEASSGDAFILFTQEGRRYVYLGEDPSGELSSVWEQVYNSRKEKNIHWITHMTPGKITSMNAMGLGEMLGEGISDRQTLDKIAAWLKENLTVDASKEIRVWDGPDNPDMPAGLCYLRIDFDTGVYYTLITYGEYDYLPDPDGSYMSLYTSDLDQTISYTLAPGSAAALRTFFDGLA